MKLSLVLFTIFAAANAHAEQGPFRLHLLSEPHTFDPQAVSSASGNYVVQNLFHGLMRLDADKGLIPDGAQKCSQKGLTITCVMAKTHVWSDGQPVRAMEYVRSFRRLLDRNLKSPQAELLLTVRNGPEVWAGKKPPTDLGVEATDEKTFRIHLRVPDSDFLNKLAEPALAPFRSDEFPKKTESENLPVTGPYKVRKWKSTDRVILDPNPHFPGNPKRPVVEALFVEDDTTALRLYEAGVLSFLRRLPSVEKPNYEHRPDFVQVELSRFDYIGFSPALKPYPKLRKALSMSLDFENYRKLFYEPGRPGCPSFSEKLYDPPVCVNFDLEKAKKLYAEEPWPRELNKRMGFSQMGGDEIRRAAEWFQGQWRRNLGLSFEMNGQEQAVYLATLRADPPPVFRKGIGLNRLSCLAGLEIFAEDNPENYVHFESKPYNDLIAKLRAETDSSRRREICTKALKLLINDNWIVPLGQLYFYMLAKPDFTGWKINSLNQLDLSQLQPASQR